jgi:serine O-acetyltransferase
MLRDIHTDLLRASDLARATRSQRLERRRIPHLLFFRVGLQALIVYRLGRWLREARRRPTSWPLALLLVPAYGLLIAYVRVGLDVHMDSSAEIGAGLQVYHFGGIRLRRCRLGRDCVIHHEVRLEPDGDGREGPRLGDRVWVGPHACILGPVRVGDGATIGAGAIVKNDVPPNSMVLGDPARVMRVAYDNSALRDRV